MLNLALRQTLLHITQTYGGGFKLSARGRLQTPKELPPHWREFVARNATAIKALLKQGGPIGHPSESRLSGFSNARRHPDCERFQQSATAMTAVNAWRDHTGKDEREFNDY